MASHSYLSAYIIYMLNNIPAVNTFDFHIYTYITLLYMSFFYHVHQSIELIYTQNEYYHVRSQTSNLLHNVEGTLYLDCDSQRRS